MRYQICVSGATNRDGTKETNKAAYEVGRSIAKRGATLTTGATIGLPHYAAMGANSVEDRIGAVVGFSPAGSLREHVATYRLPVDEFDYINFTGMQYIGRGIDLIRSSDALVLVGGRMGSLHELSTALESRKVCGILLESGGVADYVRTLVEHIETPAAKDIMYHTDPDSLVVAVIERLNEKYADFLPDIGDISIDLAEVK